jgi:translation initiation factor 3 subunit F
MIDKIPSDLEGMEVSMQRLLALIDGMCNKVDDVVVSKMAPFICSNLPVA